MIVDMNYWTKVIRKIFIFLLSLLGIYLSFKLACFYMPFLIAFIISLLLEPVIKFMMKKFKMKRKTSSIIILVVITAILLGIIAWTITTLISEGSNLLENFSTYVTNTSDLIQRLFNSETLKRIKIPDNVAQIITNSANDLLRTVTTWINSFLKSILSGITQLPSIGIYVVVMFLSLYFICTDKIYMIDQLEHHLPETWVRKIYKHVKELVKVLGKYLKAEATLILISFVISLIGLYVFKIAGLDVKYPLLYALAIGFVDALPIFGSGTVMVPWAIISACNGDIRLGVSILVLWIIMSIVRQLVEPKIVGSHIGIHPIFTLIAMYTGYKISGVIGLFIGPIVLIILKNIYSNMLDKGMMKSIFVVGERLVCFRHSVCLFTLLDCSAGSVDRVNDLSGKPVSHGLFAAAPCIGHEPAETEGLPSLGTDLHRNLISRASDTSCLDLKDRHDVVESSGERFESALSGLLLNYLECVIDYFLCNALFSVIHYVVHELCYELGIVKRIRQHISF